MPRLHGWTVSLVITLAPLALSLPASATAATISPVTLTLQQGGSTSIPPVSPAAGFGNTASEIDEAMDAGQDEGADDGEFGGINRAPPGVTTGQGKAVVSGKKPKSDPTLRTHFEGLNFFDQRFANGGNQFSVEPPDQALCVGHGFVVEAVNDVLRVYRTDGTPATGVVDLNTFFGYAAAINRATNARGPTVTDPVCIYDRAIGRFVVVVLTLDHVGTSASLNGNNHLDIAVSDSADPTGTWKIYRLPVQNNGTQGTPDHACTRGFCLGDFPKLGADANAIYLTTNEFAVFGSGFFSAQVYGVGHDLLLGGSNGSVVLFNTLGVGPDGGAFTVWPATTPGGQFDTSNGGTQYFLSGRNVFTEDGTSDSIAVWKMTNTASLNTPTPTAALDLSLLAVSTYAVPPRAKQKSGGPRPLSDCIADLTVYSSPASIFTPPGTCANRIAGTTSHNNATFGSIDTTAGMGQVTYANGKLWGALNTAVLVDGQNRVGIAYYVINPHAMTLDLQGQAGIAGTDLIYPALGVTASGRGVVSFTLTGDDDYPSAAYAAIDSQVGMGDAQIAAAGAAPWDGFASYRIFSTRPRWGDYGWASVDGNSVWIASEYVASSCTYSQYLADPTCGGTRAALGNWSTHVSKVTP